MHIPYVSDWIQAYRYELIAFLTGAAVLVLEIVGARLIAPVFGTSTYVWTAMIGVILGSLAVGYAVGGKLADRDNPANFLRRLLLVSAIFVLLMGFMQQPVLETIARMQLDLRVSALLAAVLLFGLPSLLIGMVSPHLAKLRVTSLETTGSSIGRLEAAGALGSIAGTFACVYVLLGAFGSRSIVVGVGVVLLLTAVIGDSDNGASDGRKLLVSGLLVAFFVATVINSNPANILADVDTAYARYQVRTEFDGTQRVNYLVMDRSGIQSAAAQNSDQLLFAYTRQFTAAADAYGELGRVLTIGGGAYTFPAYLSKSHSGVTVDAVEIDPALETLAAKYFNYRPSPRLRVYNADGRSYLNTNQTRYDLVYMDAFSSLSPPFQLTTRETVARINRSLVPDGVAVVNVIAAYEGGRSAYARATLETYRSAFRYVSLHPLDSSAGVGQDRQNLLLFASNDAQKYAALTKPLRHKAMQFQPGGLVLTDDYAPIERLTF